MALTLVVFCAVTAVITDVPKTPSDENVFKSACIPAHPPLSDPAIVNAVGYLFILYSCFIIPPPALPVSGSKGLISAVRHPLIIMLQR